ncbi:MAG: PAS domain-containing protein [Verrucomicrobia bacterium]|nr:PAS domain-containing protein [Verrucomicrobiota bacterium]
MGRQDNLRGIAGGAALFAALLGALGLIGVLAGWDGATYLRLERIRMDAVTALCLALAGVGLWLQAREWKPRWGQALAATAVLLALLGLFEGAFGLHLHPAIWKTHPASTNHPWASVHTSIAALTAALGVTALGFRRRSGLRLNSSWFGNLGITFAIAGLLPDLFGTSATHVLSLSLGSSTALALLLLGAGTLLARPQEKFLRMLLDAGPTGVLTRRLFLGAAVLPIVLSVVLIVCVRLDVLGIADGVVLLCGGMIICGFALTSYSAGAAVVLQEERDEAEQARQLLTARLQEQAAQLQETVGQRTRELQEANHSLRLAAESNALLAIVAEHTTNGIIISDGTARIEWVNAAFTRITGYGLADAKGRRPDEFLPAPNAESSAIDRLRQAFAQGEPARLEMLNRTKDGHPFWVACDVQPVRDRHGRVVNFISVILDITDERAAQQRLLSLNDRLGLATRSAALGVWEWDAQTGQSQWDARTLEIYGLRPEEYGGRAEDWLDRVHPDDRERMRQAFRALGQGSNEFEHEYRILRRSDQSIRIIEARAIVQRNAAGQLLRVTGTDRDVTAERDAAMRMALLNERLRLALRSSNYGVWEYDIASRRLLWDERMFELYGISRGDFDGTRDHWRQRIHPVDRERAFEHADRVISGEIPSYDIEFRILLPDGTVRHIEAHGYLQRDSTGQPLRLVGLNRDVTESKRLEDRVRKSEELAKEVAVIARIGGWEYEFDSAQLTWTEGVRLIHEVDDAFQPTLENTIPFYPESPMETWPGLIDPEDRSAREFDQEIRLRTARGNDRWVRVLGRAEFGEHGQPVRVHGTMQDVTARHEIESSRRELEVQLFQAQKMETLGTLAGGIAHDFNNLLTGIIGYHELAADSVPEDHPARACLAEARHASLRARELVEQILTFGRQSSGGGHVSLDLHGVIEEARRFLRSTLPANVTIELRIAPQLPPILGDATQIHQVILNLGSNAAHAMRQHGGTLTISAEGAEVTNELAFFLGGSPSGSYVRLTVADTGHGMDEATRRRIFDPFFTTKNTREGTGLGLAVVHGIVRAHRGAIDVESKPGAGARFHIYLPASTPEQEAPPVPQEIGPRGTGELVLVVDDEEIVGTCTKLVLENRGYAAAVFRSAEECLAAVAGGITQCSLIVTDQTMPGMQGIELITTLRKQWPELPAVLMSGYFSKISPLELDGIGQVELVAKPFTTDELTSAVHRALQPGRL